MVKDWSEWSKTMIAMHDDNALVNFYRSRSFADCKERKQLEALEATCGGVYGEQFVFRRSVGRGTLVMFRDASDAYAFTEARS